MNRVILIGRLTRNPEIRYSQNENSLAVCKFTLAVDRRVKRENEVTADFISCVAFGKTAEFFERYTRQGSKMAIEGRIQTGSYVKQDGTKVYTTDVVVDNAEFADSKPAGQGAVPNGQAQGFANQGFQNQGSQPQGYSGQQYGQGYGSNGYQNQQSYSGWQGQQAGAGWQSQGQGAGGFGFRQPDQNQSGQAFANPDQPGSAYAGQDAQGSGFAGTTGSGFEDSGQAAPMQEAADEGFMQIPDELNDEGLPFG